MTWAWLLLAIAAGYPAAKALASLIVWLDEILNQPKGPNR